MHNKSGKPTMTIPINGYMYGTYHANKEKVDGRRKRNIKPDPVI
jgi:hypothetical protein